VVSYLGYQSKEIEAVIAGDRITELDVELVPTSIELKELAIFGEKSVRGNEPDVGLEKITPEDIRLIPAGAESDIFRVLQTIPGVSTTGDVTSKYYVRGGGGDQNLVLLNGATIYNPFHALGIFSVIDPEMIAMLEFYKGGFSSEYSGRLSSVLNIVTKDGNKNQFQATGQIGFISGKLALEGPIPNGSFIATVRKSLYTDVLKNYLNEQDAPVDFYDLSFKVNSSNPFDALIGKIVLFGFMSNDNVDYEDPYLEDYSVNNNVVGLVWNKVWSSPLLTEFKLSYSGFDAVVEPNLSKSKPRKNRVKDISSDLNFTYMYGNRDEILFGIQNKFVSTDLELENLYGRKTDFAQEGWDMSLFVNYKFLRWDNIGFETGIRARLLSLSEKRPMLIEPRVTLTFKPLPYIALKAGAGRYSQEIVTITNEEDIISIFDPWIIVPDYAAAPQATHFTAGINYFISEYVNVDLEGYYKIMTDLLEENDRKFSGEFSDYINVDGESYGFESTLQFQSPVLIAKAAYALSWSYKIKDGIKYFPRYDKRHNLNLLLAVDLGNGWRSNILWSFSSGMPFTPITGFYDRVDIQDAGYYYDFYHFTGSTHWGLRNSTRLPVYHRLDISLTKNMKIYIADVTIEGSILNVYDRANIFYFSKDTAERVNMLPFLPSLSIKVKI
jgi:hypothetical protein